MNQSSQLPVDGDIATVPTIVDETTMPVNQTDSDAGSLAGTFVPMLPR